ncbi:MAG: hypothetical protein AB1941_00780 [Gemmatimonadota bacterium]
MEPVKGKTRRKLARDTRRPVKRHGQEVATTLLLSLASSAATALIERAQRKRKKGGKGRKAMKKQDG